MSTSVLVADNYEPYRRFVRSTLRKRPELQIIGEVSDGFEAVLMVQEMHPDLILLDISLPTIDGIEVARRICQISPQSRIIFVTENRSADMAKNALSIGACGYLVKSDSASELLPAVQAVLEGKHYVSRSLQI
jgi:DNA-binding NarL/FixJ family response regulator